jgi:hypothetical protein
VHSLHSACQQDAGQVPLVAWGGGDEAGTAGVPSGSDLLLHSGRGGPNRGTVLHLRESVHRDSHRGPAATGLGLGRGRPGVDDASSRLTDVSQWMPCRQRGWPTQGWASPGMGRGGLQEGGPGKEGPYMYMTLLTQLVENYLLHTEARHSGPVGPIRGPVTPVRASRVLSVGAELVFFPAPPHGGVVPVTHSGSGKELLKGSIGCTGIRVQACQRCFGKKSPSQARVDCHDCRCDSRHQAVSRRPESALAGPRGGRGRLPRRSSRPGPPAPRGAPSGDR